MTNEQKDRFTQIWKNLLKIYADTDELKKSAAALTTVGLDIGETIDGNAESVLALAEEIDEILTDLKREHDHAN